MESIGEKFRTRREEKGLFIEQIARDTNISKKFIAAIENEDYTEIPGETYLIGFFRTYAEYLNISPAEIITLYKNQKIQEQPVPEELLPKKKTNLSTPVFISVSILLAAAILSGIFFLSKNKEDKGIEIIETDNIIEKISDTENIGSEYIMSDAFIEKKFKEGDIIKIPIGNSKYNILCKTIDSTVILNTPQGEVELTVGNDYRVDLSGDNKTDIRIILRDVDKKGKLAVLKFDKTTEAPAIASSEINSPEELSEVSRIAAESSESIGNSNIESRKQKSKIIFKADKIAPFTLNILFRGYCLMRYSINDNQREERYFHKGETFRLDVPNSVKLWLSNSGSTTVNINGEEYTPGKSGEVSVNLIKWAKDKNNNNVILSVPMY